MTRWVLGGALVGGVGFLILCGAAWLFIPHDAMDPNWVKVGMYTIVLSCMGSIEGGLMHLRREVDRLRSGNGVAKRD